MKHLVVIAGVLALGACAEGAPEAEAETEESAEVQPADMTDWQGGYTFTSEDGSEASLEISADGTYEVTSGEETVSGVITMGEGGAFCYTPDGGEDTECWTNGEAADDGSWQATSDQGNTVTVTRIEAPTDSEAG